MDTFWGALLWLMVWLPAGVAVRVVGLALGFGLVALLKATPLRRPAIAVGEAVNLCSLVLAGLLPIVAGLGGLIVGIVRVSSASHGSGGAGLIVGAVVTAVLAPLFLYLLVFSADRSPRDTA